jgi:HEAT repeats
MSKGVTWWAVAGSLFAIAGGGFFALRHGSHATSSDPSAGDRFAGFSTRPFSNDVAPPPPPETPDQMAHQVEDAMMRWRAAILTKDAATVVALDQDFHTRPARYRTALEKSARSDENERVRAFSTRVLGKLKDAQEAPLLKQLLNDSSPYVRQNAAWGLGELGGAGAVAMAELKHARKKDSAEAVRLAAKDALGKVE